MPQHSTMKKVSRKPKPIECPECSSQKITKHGTTEKGIQRYECQDCSRTFTGNASGRPKKSMGICPKCNSEDRNTTKLGGGNGFRIFCKDCNRSHQYASREEYKAAIAEQKQYEKLNKP